MSAVISLTPPTSVAAHSPSSSVVASAHPAPYGWQTHVVRPGDTLSDLAIAHRTTVGALVAHNGLTGGGSYLRLGQRLSVPRTTSRGAGRGPRGGAALDGVHRAPGRHDRRDRAAARHLRVRHPRGQRAAAQLGDPPGPAAAGVGQGRPGGPRLGRAGDEHPAGAGAPRRHRRRDRPAARRDAGLDPQGQRPRARLGHLRRQGAADPGGLLADRRPRHLRRADVLQCGGGRRGGQPRLPRRRRRCRAGPTPGR